MSRLFVSDVHLDAGAPEASEQFLEFLRSHAADAEALYILGDLFEAWVGDDDPDPAKARICDGLRALTAGGVGCFVLHGNRDFLMGRGFCQNTGSRLLADPVVADLDGRESVADTWRCVVHRRPLLSGVTQHRQDIGVATSLSFATSRRSRVAGQSGACGKQGAHLPGHPQHHGRE